MKSLVGVAAVVAARSGHEIQASNAAHGLCHSLQLHLNQTSGSGGLVMVVTCLSKALPGRAIALAGGGMRAALASREA